MGLAGGGLWRRLSKARAMSARELATRVAYKGALSVERRRHRQGTLAPPGRLGAAVRADLRGDGWQARLVSARQHTTARFLPSVHERAAMRGAFVRRPDEAQRARAAADAAAAGKFQFFGRDFTYGPSIDWQADPVSGRSWPSSFHADVPVHGGDVGFGDVKHVWELSRQQYLIDLGRAFFLSDERSDLEAMERLVRSWIAGNPYATGVNWACALEPAFRAWSWLWAYHLTADALDDAFHLEWLEGFYDHGRFLARHLELYSSPYNHLIGEAAALYALGHAFPEFADAAALEAAGRSVLEDRLHQQFYDDGGSVEQSTFYHHATARVLPAGRADRTRERRGAVPARLAGHRARPRVQHAADAAGRPDAGDRRRRRWQADSHGASAVLGLPAVPGDRRGALRARRLQGGGGPFLRRRAVAAGPAEAQPPSRRSRPRPARKPVPCLGHSGYVVLRSDWSERADYVCVDVGEQAAGMRTDARAQLDARSRRLPVGAARRSRAGRVLVDSGLFAYNCGGAWESHFRETAAHNTVKVDGRDQARHIGKMAWSHSYRARIEARDAGIRAAGSSVRTTATRAGHSASCIGGRSGCGRGLRAGLGRVRGRGQPRHRGELSVRAGRAGAGRREAGRVRRLRRDGVGRDRRMGDAPYGAAARAPTTAGSAPVLASARPHRD